MDWLGGLKVDGLQVKLWSFIFMSNCLLGPQNRWSLKPVVISIDPLANTNILTSSSNIKL